MNDTRKIVAGYMARKALQGMQQETDPAMKPVLPSQLAAYIHSGAPDDQIKAAINGNLITRRHYLTLLQSTRALHFDKVAAAATRSEIIVRETNQCRLKVIESKASNDELYVVLELNRLVKPSRDKITLHVIQDGNAEKLDMSPVHDGKAQAIIARGGTLHLLINHVDSEIYVV